MGLILLAQLLTSMGFLRRICTALGFVKTEAHSSVEDEKVAAGDSASRQPAQGFCVQTPFSAEKPSAGPVVVPCSLGEGGVQGFRWYSRRLRIDEDGDVADEFIDEIQPPVGSGDQKWAPRTKFEVNYTTRPAPVRKQAITIDGNVHPCMEHQGMLCWV